MKTIIEHAASSSLEVCGFVTYEDGEFKSEPAKNIASYADDVFEIHPLEILKKMRSGKLVAIYHSHPTTGEEESKFDQFNCDNSCIPYLIYSKQSEKFNLVMPKISHVKKEYVDLLKKNYD
jgi:proteasome lid subunit RPN8/RPN11